MIFGSKSDLLGRFRFKTAINLYVKVPKNDYKIKKIKAFLKNKVSEIYYLGRVKRRMPKSREKNHPDSWARDSRTFDFLCRKKVFSVQKLRFVNKYFLDILSFV